MVGEIQGDHTSQTLPRIDCRAGQLGEQQGERDDATDDHVHADDPAPVDTGKTSP